MTETTTEPIVESPVTFSFPEFPDRVVTQSEPINAGITQDILVTGSVSHRGQPFVGRIMSLNYHMPNEDRATFTGDGGRTLVYGTVVNPEPVHGCYYRTLVGPGSPAEAGRLLQYIDNGHADQRNHAQYAWNIIAGADGQAWPYPNDSTSSPGRLYVEVMAPEGLDVQPAEATPEQMAEEAGGVQTVDASEDGPAMGWARDEGEGRALVRPEPVQGEHYVLWNANSQNVAFLGVFVGGSVMNSFTQLDRTDGGIRAENRFAALYTNLEDLRWAPARRKQAERKDPTDEEQRAAIATLRDTLAEKQARLSALNEALNEKAKEQNWCSEYEGVIEPLGLEPREQNKDWDVEVEVEFRLTDNSPSSQMDERLDSEYGIAIVSSSVEVYGKATVTVRVEDQPDDDDEISESIDTDMVENALCGAVGSSVDLDVSDWTIESRRPVG